MLKINGHDNAIIGVATPIALEHEQVLIYKGERIVDNLVGAGMTEEEATEYISFNIEGAFVGKSTPIISWDYYDES